METNGIGPGRTNNRNFKKEEVTNKNDKKNTLTKKNYMCGSKGKYQARAHVRLHVARLAYLTLRTACELGMGRFLSPAANRR